MIVTKSASTRYIRRYEYTKISRMPGSSHYGTLRPRSLRVSRLAAKSNVAWRTRRAPSGDSSAMNSRAWFSASWAPSAQITLRRRLAIDVEAPRQPARGE